jgi:hypothetical protein
MDALIRSAMLDFYPSTDELPGLDQVDLDGFLERYKREAPALLWSGVIAGAVAYNMSPIFTIGKPLPASKLSPEDRDRHVDAVGSSNSYHLRQLIFLLKMVAGMAWGQSPAVRSAMGLPVYPEDPGTWRQA